MWPMLNLGTDKSLPHLFPNITVIAKITVKKVVSLKLALYWVLCNPPSGQIYKEICCTALPNKTVQGPLFF